MEEVNGVAYGGGVVDCGSGFDNVEEGGRFEETGEEEVPLQVGEGEELVRRRHREPKTGDGPSFYSGVKVKEEKFYYYSLLAIEVETVSGDRTLCKR